MVKNVLTVAFVSKKVNSFFDNLYKHIVFFKYLCTVRTVYCTLFSTVLNQNVLNQSNRAYKSKLLIYML